MGCAAPKECVEHSRLKMMLCEQCNEHVCRQCAFYCNKSGHPLVSRMYDMVKQTKAYFAQIQKLEAPMTFRKRIMTQCMEARDTVTASYDLDRVLTTVHSTVRKVLQESAPMWRGIVTKNFPIKSVSSTLETSDLELSRVSTTSQHRHESEKSPIRGEEELKILLKQVELLKCKKSSHAVTQLVAKTTVESQLEELSTHVSLDSGESLDSLIHKALRLILQSIKVPEIKRTYIKPLYFNASVPLHKHSLMNDHLIGCDGDILVIAVIENEYLTLRCFGINGNTWKHYTIWTDFYVLKLSHGFIRIMVCHEYVCIYSMHGTVSIYRIKGGKKVITKGGFQKHDLMKIYQGEDGTPKLVCWNLVKSCLEFHGIADLMQKPSLAVEGVVFESMTTDNVIKLRNKPMLVTWHAGVCAILDASRNIFLFDGTTFKGQISSLQHGVKNVDQMEFQGRSDRLVLCDHSNKLMTVCAEKVSPDGFTSSWSVDKVFAVKFEIVESENVRHISTSCLEKALIFTNKNIYSVRTFDSMDGSSDGKEYLEDGDTPPGTVV